MNEAENEAAMNDKPLRFEDLGFYEKMIVTDSGCNYSDAWKVERVMRDDIFHSSLDSLSRAQLRLGARKAFALLGVERPMYEEYFAQTRRVFEEMKTANGHRVLDVAMEATP